MAAELYSGGLESSQPLHLARSGRSSSQWEQPVSEFSTQRNPVTRWAKAAITALIMIAPAMAPAQTPTKEGIRPVNTFSIVARDPVTGELGVAVQSHWFSVGTLVPWLEPGVGAVATQSFVDPNYGKLGLELMRGGKSASDALRAL